MSDMSKDVINIEGIHRFPGIPFFREKDKDIFFGRWKEVENLITKILLNKTVVLHAASGIGKSSLIEAGLIPKLKKEYPGMMVVTVKFQGIIKSGDKSKDHSGSGKCELIDQTLKRIKQKSDVFSEQPPYISELPDDLWYQAKLLQANGKSLLLIFDQFEDIQSYSVLQLEYFKDRLSRLFNSYIPEDYYDQFNKEISCISEDKQEEINRNAALIRQPPDVRALFVIRSDQLGTMSLLANRFPDILKNDIYLLPLDRPSAREAISKPPQIEGNSLDPPMTFTSGSFSFDDKTIDYILDHLADPNDDRIDPIEIQIICRTIEQKVETELKKKQEPKEDPTGKSSESEVHILEDEPVDGKWKIRKDYEPEIDKTVTEFYNKSWVQVREKLKVPEEDFLNLKQQIIGQLILKGKGKRPLVPKEIFSEKEDIMAELCQYGLIRTEKNEGIEYYRLCHDRFIEPLQNDLNKIENTILQFAKEKELQKVKNERRIERKWKIYAIILTIIITIFSGIFIFNLNSFNGQLQIKTEKLYHELSVNAILNNLNIKLNNRIGFGKEGLALAYNMDKQLFGYINKNGDIKIDYQFIMATPFSQSTGIAHASVSNLYDYDAILFYDKKTKTSQQFNSIYNLNDLNSLKNLPSRGMPVGALTLVDLQDTFQTNSKNIWDTIFMRNQLLELKISRCAIKAIPDNIANLTNLVKLDFSDNELQAFPNSILKLDSSLEWLDLQNNKLKRLPDDLLKLKNLEVLLLKNNKLNFLPKNICKLSKLQKLDLSNNPLHFLPKEMMDLKHLQTLIFTIRKRFSIPQELFDSTNIKWSIYDINICVDSSNYKLANQLASKIKNSKNLTHMDYWALSYYYLISGDFANSIWAGKNYSICCVSMNIMPEIGALSNLAMGYLWNGDYENALTLIITYKDSTSYYNNPKGEKGSAIFLEDIATLEGKNIPPKNHKDVENVQQLLKGNDKKLTK